MNAPPSVTIVLPTYNGSRFLEGSVRSCLEQDHRDFELIVVDDCSTDGTPAIIERLARLDPRIRPVRNEANRKLPATLNAGFDLAVGRYLTWTSDDNLFRPSAIARMVAALESSPDVDVVYSDFTQIDDSGAPIRLVRAGEPGEIGERNVVGACFLLRRAVHEGLGGYAEDLFLAEDYDFWLRAACRYRLRPIHEDLYLYRVHAASLTGRLPDGQERMTATALERHIGSLRLGRGRPRASAYLRLVDLAAARGDFALARKYLLAAFLSAPGHARKAARPGLVLRALIGGRLYVALRGLVRGGPRADATTR